MPSDRSPAGICMFDVDGTLTAAPRSLEAGKTRSEPVQACLAADYLVGVATASGRQWQDVCTAAGRSTGREAWATDDLCTAMASVGFSTFCSTGGARAQIGGVPISDLPESKIREFAALTASGRHGLLKGWAMEQVRLSNFPDVPAADLILFDNEPTWVRDAILTGVSAFCVHPENSNGCESGVPVSDFDWEGVHRTLKERKASQVYATPPRDSC